jgi:hypothetical protein
MAKVEGIPAQMRRNPIRQVLKAIERLEAQSNAEE